MFEPRNRIYILVGASLLTNFALSKRTYDLGKPFTAKVFTVTNMIVSILITIASYFLLVLKIIYQDLVVDIMFVLIFATMFVWEMFIVKNHCVKSMKTGLSGGYCRDKSRIRGVGYTYSFLMIMMPILIFFLYRYDIGLVDATNYISDALMLSSLNPLFTLIFRLIFPFAK